MTSAKAGALRSIVIGLAFVASGATAAIAGTNFPALADYPAPNCAKPGGKPVLTAAAPKTVAAGGMSFNTGGKDVKDYNERVAQYNAALHDYTACMNAYVANGQDDIDAIRNKVNQAVEQGKVP